MSRIDYFSHKLIKIISENPLVIILLLLLLTLSYFLSGKVAENFVIKNKIIEVFT